MNRRTVLKGLGVTTGLALAGNALELKGLSSSAISQATAGRSLTPASTEVRLIETQVATLRISEQTGDLVGLHWKDPDLELIQEPRLGSSAGRAGRRW